MNRMGAVLVFKAGLTREEVNDAIAVLMPLIDLEYHLLDGELAGITFVKGENGEAVEKQIKVPSTDIERADKLINVFDDDFGGPVWYVP